MAAIMGLKAMRKCRAFLTISLFRVSGSVCTVIHPKDQTSMSTLFFIYFIIANSMPTKSYRRRKKILSYFLVIQVIR
jgi:hypothetical protein